jgi:mannan endo-1,4-beta-mannosidase
MERDHISRRKLLALVGVTASVSGCSGGGGGETAESPATDTVSTPTATATPDPATQTQFDSFVHADGRHLAVDGKRFHAFGTRPQNVMDLSHPVEWVDEMFTLLADEGYTLARVHAFQPFWGDESKQPAAGETSEDVMERLDLVVAAARRHGIRLSVMLINGKPALHSADSLDDNRGVNAHTYANEVASAEEYDDFYTDAECKRLYKQRVRTVLTRENTITGVAYRDEPAIAMWELGNEIEWAEPWKHSDPTLQPWPEEMANHVKSIDDNHLVTTGEFGWANRNNFVADHRPDAIDVTSMHYYPGPNGYDLPNDPERDHPGVLRDLIETSHDELELPAYVGEYNWGVETGAEPPLSRRNEELAVIHSMLDDVDVAAAAYHSLALSDQQDWPRGSATTFGDTDDGSMAEFRRFATIQREKSAPEALPNHTPSA